MKLLDNFRRPNVPPPLGHNQAAADGPRAALRAAQAEATQATAAAQTAKEVAERAAAIVTRAEEILTLHSDLDELVADQRARALEAGGEVGALPQHLADARHAVSVAIQERDDAHGTAQLLAARAQELAAVAEKAKAALRLAADAVAQQGCLFLIERMKVLEVEAARLRTLALAITNRTISDPPVTWGITEIRHNPQHSSMVDVARPDWTALTAEWDAHRRALETDADAEPPT